jgi:hypothetical protein
LVRDGRSLKVHLDGDLKPEIAGDVVGTPTTGLAWFSIGTRGDDVSHFEGKLDEVALYDRALDAAEVAAHLRAANGR